MIWHVVVPNYGIKASFRNQLFMASPLLRRIHSTFSRENLITISPIP